jgi:hypothetical protein
MLDRDQYAAAVLSFLSEMSVICLRQTPDGLSQLPGFNEEVKDARVAICDPNASNAQALSAAFGLVDEFAQEAWESVLDQSFAAYRSQSSTSTTR